MHIKSILSGIFCFVFCVVPYTVYGVDYDPEDLNKLFTDKDQRMQIDAGRSGKASPSGIQKTSEVEVSGYVTRSEGKSVVWLNDKNTLESPTVDGARVHQSSIGNNKKVTITMDGKTKSLKPGESWSKSTGKVKDNY